MTVVRVQKGTKLQSSKWERCPQCARPLCKRIPMHDDDEEVWGFHIKHRGMEIYTAEVVAVFICPSCGLRTLISSKDGIRKQR